MDSDISINYDPLNGSLKGANLGTVAFDPGEIENCLLGHPAVAMAGVIGKPDELRTEIVKAFIKLNAGYMGSDELAREIQLWVKTRLSAHEYPREIAFINDFPLTTTSKIIRRKLREI